MIQIICENNYILYHPKYGERYYFVKICYKKKIRFKTERKGLEEKKEREREREREREKYALNLYLLRHYNIYFYNF